MAKCKNCHCNCHCDGDLHNHHYDGDPCTCDNCACKNKKDNVEDKRTYTTDKEWASDLSFENNGGLVVGDTGECESCQ